MICMNIVTLPQSSQAQIQYFLAKEDWVKLSLHDHLGAKLGTFIQDEQKKGKYQFTWDFSKFKAGYYYIQLHTQGRKLVKRLEVKSSSQQK